MRTRRQDNQKVPCRGCPRGPGKAPAKDTHEAPARLFPRAPTKPRQDPCREYQQDRGKALPPRRRPSSAANPATKQVPMWQYVAPKPTSQAPTWCHADLREDSATTPAQQPASLHGAACLVGLDVCRSKATWRRTRRASLPPPIKQEDT